MSQVRGEPVVTKPLCLTYFVDETGHELFADPKYPIFGIGGIAMMAAHLDAEVREPWREVKAKHFGGRDVPLHAADLRQPTPEQLQALGNYFRNGRFQRFAAVIHSLARLPADKLPFEVVAPTLLKRFEEVAARWVPRPEEVWFVHEASDRGDEQLERYIGKLSLEADGCDIPVHQGLMEKRVGDPALEVADFVVQAAGGQAHHWARGRDGFRQDFKAVFHVPNYLRSFMYIDAAQFTPAAKALSVAAQPLEQIVDDAADDGRQR